MKKSVALIVCMAILLCSCVVVAQTNLASENDEKIFLSKADTMEKISEDDVWKTIKEAYVYSFPLVLMDATMKSATNAEIAGPIKAPINQFNHRKALANAQSKNVVSPNVDTMYSQVWYDLSKEPIIYVLPDTDRFCKVQVLDAWTNTPAVLEKAGAYAITLSSWTGELPNGVVRVNVPTSMAWSITRTVLSGEDDLSAVYAIQSQMKLMPLSAYLDGGEYQAPNGSFSEENNYVPINKVMSMGPAEFFNKANELMKTNPPAVNDTDMLKKIAAVNVGPGMTFDTSILTGDVKATWTEMLQGLRRSLVPIGMKFSKKLGQWNYFDEPIGNFGTEYDFRALVAIAGLGANTVEVALYPKTDVDASGDMLTGENTYVLHFDSYPQVLEGGFWSVTAYGDDDFLIDNPIDRYCINDRSGLKQNDDGTVDVILSKDAPEDTTNWLPIGDSKFHLYMRIYTPNMVALNNWTPPTITMYKKKVDVYAEADDFTYGDTEKTGYINLSVPEHDDLTASLETTYYKADGITKTDTSDGASIEGGMPTNAGTYNVVISIPKSNEEFLGSKTITFTIEKRVLTIKPNSKNAYIGNSVPELDEDDFNAKGLVGSDKLLTKPVLAYESEPNMKESGKVAIKASGADAGDNYTINYEDGTLTIKKKHSSSVSGIGSSCMVKFDTNGGNIMQNISVMDGSKIGTLEIPQKEGFVFTGWYSDKECTKKYDIDTEVTSSTTLYAGWKVSPIRQLILTIDKKDATVWNESKTTDVAPVIRNDRTMIPARFVAENLGAKVDWSEDEQKVTITKGNIVIIIYINSDKAYVNNEEITLDSPAFVENDRTYTPLRFISENLGASVEWFEEAQQVVITKGITETTK